VIEAAPTGEAAREMADLAKLVVGEKERKAA
jgi:hypothetical protein